MWWLIVAVLVAGFVVIAIVRTPQQALGIIVPISMFVPAWEILMLVEGPRGSIVGSGFDIKVAVSALCLLLYCFMPGRTFPCRFVPCDFAALAMVLIHLALDFMHDGVAWSVLARAAAEWYLPYVAARAAFQSRATINAVWPVIAGALAFVAVAAVVEAFLRWNLFEQLFGVRPYEGFNPNASRWGIKRANGFTMHPIYLGVVQVLLSGWAFYAVFRALHRRSKVFWLALPLFPVAGILATASRGPIVGFAVSVAALTFLTLPKLRPVMIGMVVLVALLAFTQRDAVLSALATWGDEGKPREIVIDDEVRLNSSVRTRVNALAVYSIAFKRAGLFGFGTQAVSGFPVNVPLGPREVKTLKAVKYVDNTYLLMTLRFGYLGLAVFLTMGVLAVLQLVLVARANPGNSPQWLCWSLFASTTGALIALLTVWMPHEIGFPLLWTYGASSGLFWTQRAGKLSR